MTQYSFSFPVKATCIALFKKVTPALLASTIAVIPVSDAFAGPKQASIVIDVRTGKVMAQEDPDGLRYPASLTKMMTLYLVFEALDAGKISLNSRVPVSKHAAAQPPSKLGVRPGQTFTVEQGIYALVTRSANDCATALAEFLGGSEPRFGKMMTAKARSLGMRRTVYHNANGLPDARQVTTARDQALLSAALRKNYPEYYHYFSTRSFKYGKQVIGNHNRLLGSVKGVDGIKTGFTRAAGFNLATSAQLDGRSIVAVVLGSPSGGSRNAKMKKLVQAYLPKAARRGGDPDAFVDNSPSTITAVTAYQSTIELPDSGPIPSARYSAEEARAKIRAQEEQIRVAATRSIDLPPSDIPAAKTVETAQADSSLDQLTTASTGMGAKGWVIQVGASPAKDQAIDLLQQAQDKGGKVLRSATPFTVAYIKGSEQLYRARFGGFADQREAVRACDLLKRRGMGCWASLQ